LRRVVERRLVFGNLSWFQINRMRDFVPGRIAENVLPIRPIGISCGERNDQCTRDRGKVDATAALPEPR
jgi:hypothetical protein